MENYVPEIPFFVMDPNGLWDISKSATNPIFKPVSISSIMLMRMPYIYSMNKDGSILDGLRNDSI